MKTNEQLLADFKRSNKERRLKIAQKAGFTTTEDYILSLTSVKSTKTKGKTAPKKEKTKAPEKLDYVVAFDTTGSMSSYITEVKNHVEQLIPEMFSQGIDLRMKIVAFGDYCDMPSPTTFGKAYQESQLTDNKNELIAFVNKAKNTSGGDGDEFYELVIKKITEETPWREGSRRAVLFIADADPHRPDYRIATSNYGRKEAGIDWREEAKKAAKLGVAFDTMSIHGDSYPWYKELANITKGVYMPFRSSNKVQHAVKMSAYARGSEMSKASFSTAYMAAMDSGDEELIGTYKSLSTLL